MEEDPRNYIELPEYLRICEHNGFKLEKDKLQLSDYLHDLGVCLHFQQDPILRNTLILKPKWGTDAVFAVLDDAQVIENLGKFSQRDLCRIWTNPDYRGMEGALLQLMINFELCYQIPDTVGEYIAPQLIDKDPPDYEWNETDNLQLRYSYPDFMPKGIVTRFIVKMHRNIWEQKYVWRSGVVLDRDDTKAEIVEYYSKREIHIRVTGKNRKDLLTVVMFNIEEINNSFYDLNYQRFIPCNCQFCSKETDPHFYRYNVLINNFAMKGFSEIQCQKHPSEKVNVFRLIGDVVNVKYTERKDKDFKRDYRKDYPTVTQFIFEGDNPVLKIDRSSMRDYFSSVHIDRSQHITNVIKQLNINPNAGELLNDLIDSIERLKGSVPSDKQDDLELIEEDKDNLEKELKASKPKPSKIVTYLNRIADNAKKIGDTAKPWVDIAGKLIPMFTGGG